MVLMNSHPDQSPPSKGCFGSERATFDEPRVGGSTRGLYVPAVSLYPLAQLPSVVSSVRFGQNEFRD